MNGEKPQDFLPPLPKQQLEKQMVVAKTSTSNKSNNIFKERPNSWT